MKTQKNICINFSWNQVGYFVLGVIFLGLSYLNFRELLVEWARLSPEELLKTQIYSLNLNQLAIIKDIFFEYLLLVGVIFLFAKGVKLRLNPHNKMGLIHEILFAPLLILILGLSIDSGLIFGLIFGLTASLLVLLPAVLFQELDL